MEYVTTDVYRHRHRDNRPQPLKFQNPILNTLVFETDGRHTPMYGILAIALTNWCERMLLGELPTLDNMGKQFEWGSFESFEASVQSIYDRLSKNRKDRLERRAQRR